MAYESRFTLKMMIDMAAPHTWAGSVMPVLLATAFAICNGYETAPLTIVSLLAICVLMQSSVNVFNDYFDYVKGVDSEADDVDEDDSVLVYNDIDPKKALILAIVYLVLAFLIGIYIILIAGFVPLVIALIGALFVVFYSAGKTPLSYLPIGELASGCVMGALIPLASYYVYTSMLEPLVILWSLPAVFGIALIMMTNNTCDIEKDSLVLRRTLPVRLGRERSCSLYHAIIILWILAIVANVCMLNLSGWIVVVFMLFASYPFVSALMKNPLAAGTRKVAMSQICALNVVLGAFYALALLF